MHIIRSMSSKVIALSSGVHLLLMKKFVYSKAEGLRSLYCLAVYGTYIVFPPQDQLSADMYNFASKEGDYARYYVTVGAPQFNINDPEGKMEMRCKYGPFHYNRIVC